MMHSLATVVAVERNQITVSCQQQTSCGSCASQNSCGTGVISKVLPGRQHQLTLSTKHVHEPIEVGQLVEIGLSERSVLQSALLVYVLPLVCMLLGTLLGQWWFVELAGGGEGGVIAGALAGGALGLLLARRRASGLSEQGDYQPSLIRVLGQPVADSLSTNALSKDSSSR
ncbi:SoxR reducing system RseC family protein [Photobacterium galatheae]|uniref:Sigma-E factor regulatory protein n=1 Tax=Photobacterium galatheae TaxID=1654360 RepID=A0A066RU55_9GAMM|nr:SoxR reducing system RseC family protein [Photobacterium galatheae]KDM92631.1 sigma-E factor regulatory protein [Photobacterium galatheae]MCM0149450.1 SoxR reducing system RseC family protein [Photobacterium galatheae]